MSKPWFSSCLERAEYDERSPSRVVWNRPSKFDISCLCGHLGCDFDSLVSDFVDPVAAIGLDDRTAPGVLVDRDRSPLWCEGRFRGIGWDGSFFGLDFFINLFL